MTSIIHGIKNLLVGTSEKEDAPKSIRITLSTQDWAHESEKYDLKRVTSPSEQMQIVRETTDVPEAALKQRIKLVLENQPYIDITAYVPTELARNPNFMYAWVHRNFGFSRFTLTWDEK